MKQTQNNFLCKALFALVLAPMVFVGSAHASAMDNVLNERFEALQPGQGELPAIEYELSEAAQAAKSLLSKMTNRAGIFFFYKSDCRYCEVQAPIIKQLERDGFDVLAVTIDGQPLSTAHFENTQLDQGHAQRLSVKSTPALFLMSREGEFTSLGEGTVPYEELVSRILVVGVSKGWITNDDINAVYPKGQTTITNATRATGE